MEITCGKKYETESREEAFVCFGLEHGEGFVGLVKNFYGMCRWWDKNGVDSRDKKYNLKKEIKEEFIR